MSPRETLEAFDGYLTAGGIRLDAVVIGGAALNLLGIISRATKDCDILDPRLPALITDAARSFAAEARKRGLELENDWLNNGPASLVSVLPPGWRERLQPAFTGVSIELQCLGRMDLLRSKLFALCDRGLDLGDCLALAPAADELGAIMPWLEQQDGHPEWPAHVRITPVDHARRLDHAV